MINIEIYKKALGNAGKKLSEPEIQSLLKIHYALAATLFSIWLKKDNVITGKGQIIQHSENGNCIAIFTYQFLYVSR